MNHTQTHHIHQIPILDLPQPIALIPRILILRIGSQNSRVVSHRSNRAVEEVHSTEIRRANRRRRVAQTNALASKKMLCARELGKTSSERGFDCLDATQNAQWLGVVCYRVCGEDVGERVECAGVNDEGVFREGLSDVFYIAQRGGIVELLAWEVGRQLRCGYRGGREVSA